MRCFCCGLTADETGSSVTKHTIAGIGTHPLCDGCADPSSFTFRSLEDIVDETEAAK